MHLAADPDLFARVAVGRIVSLTGHVAHADPFSFTAHGANWVDHEWLSGVVFYFLSQHGGDAALFGLKIALLGVFLVLLASAARRFAGQASLLPFLWTSFFTYYVWYSTIRCQVFTYVCLAFYFYLFTVYRERVSVLAAFAYIGAMLLWTNLHGGFVVGLLFLGTFSVVRYVENRAEGLKYLLILFACVSVTLINPYGFDYWRYMYQALALDRDFVSEWNPVGIFSPVGLLITVIFALELSGWARSKSRTMLELSLFSVSYILALKHLRLAAPFFMAASVWGGPYLLSAFSVLPGRIRRTRYGNELTAVLCSLILGAYALVILGRQQPFALDYSAFPVRPAEYLSRSGRSGNLINSFNDGSFLLWRLYPRFLVSLDGRYEEVYDDTVVQTARCAIDPACIQTVPLAPNYLMLRSGWLSPDAVRTRFGDSRIVFRDADWLVYAIGNEAQKDDPEGLSIPSADVLEHSIWSPRWFSLSGEE